MAKFMVEIVGSFHTLNCMTIAVEKSMNCLLLLRLLRIYTARNGKAYSMAMTVSTAKDT